MVEGKNTQQAQDSQQGNGRGGPSEPHCFHLLVADSGLSEYQHPARRSYMVLCGMELADSELPDSLCDPECERGITYCLECLRDAAERNADAGLVWSPPRTQLMLDSSAQGVGW